jgi:hypothetical protein
MVLEQLFDSLSKLCHDPLVSTNNLVEMSNRVLATQAKSFRVAHLFKEDGGFVHGLGRNAAPVETGAAHQFLFNNAYFGS